MEAAVAEVLLQPAVPGPLEVAVVRPGVEALTTAAFAAEGPGAAEGAGLIAGADIRLGHALDGMRG